MANFSALGDLLGSVLERGARLMDRGDVPRTVAALTTACEELMGSRGEASGVALATEILSGFEKLSEAERCAFFKHLAEAYDPDADAVRDAALAYAGDATLEAFAALQEAAEPPRQELFRRLNLAPGGTAQLVRMRAQLLTVVSDHPDLARIDHDFRHLLASWFNRGFLVLRPIDWQTPAALLEKIIDYEAVHQIDSWDELRRRVAPPDRRCFAFFHPSMPDEPLIFVEVALTRDVPSAIRDVLASTREIVLPEQATTAVFYSISNCQAGLAGVSFGAFLIKQVARDLKQELPGLKEFVTLSPVPGFVRWLGQQAEANPDGDAVLAMAAMAHDGYPGQAPDARLLRLAASYFLEARRSDGQPPDPVARFHLGNGAELYAINWRGDVSAKGIAQAGGIMVNYRYALDAIEVNHEAYVTDGKIAAARAVRGLLKS